MICQLGKLSTIIFVCGEKKACGKQLNQALREKVRRRHKKKRQPSRKPFWIVNL